MILQLLASVAGHDGNKKAAHSLRVDGLLCWYVAGLQFVRVDALDLFGLDAQIRERLTLRGVA